MGFDPQKALAERDETRNMQNRIGIQIMELNPICKEKAAKKRVRRKRESSEDEGKEDYPEAWRRPGDDFWTGDEGLRWIILENANLIGVRQLLVPNLGLDPITDDRGVGVRGLGPLSGGTGGGAGHGRASFAHGGGAQQELCGNGDEREVSLEQNARKKMTAAEWGEQLPLCGYFYLTPRNRRFILAAHCEGEAAGRIRPSTCQHHGCCGLHYAR
jgi:hypothetical protein